MASIKLNKIKQMAVDNLPCENLTEELIWAWDVRAITSLAEKFRKVMPEWLLKRPLMAELDRNGDWVVKTLKR